MTRPNKEIEGRIDHRKIISAYSYDEATGEVWKTTEPRKPRTKNNRGYYTIVIRRKPYLLHRFIWFYVHGSWPEECIDHINGDRSDNRLVNLRLADKSQNGCYSRPPGQFGFRGVRKAPKSPLRPYFAALRKRGTIFRSVQFETIQEAAAAYDRLAIEHHGQFAVLNFGERYEQH